MIAVVTGSSGFIGSHLVDRLLDEGWTVRVVARDGGRRGERSGVERRVVRWDDARATAVDAALEGADVVFHLAGVTKARTEAEFHRGNVLPTSVLASALSRRARPARLVLVSSQAAAGPAPSPHRPIHEDDPPRPVEAYGRSKLAAERAALAVGDRVPVTIVRPTAVYGPRDRDFLPLFVTARLGFSVSPGTRARWLDVVHVADVVDGMLRATAERAIGETLFLAGAPVRWSAVHEEIARTVGRDVVRLDLPDTLVRVLAVAGDALTLVTGRATLLNSHKAALGREDHWLCSDARARAILGYSPRRALPEGLRETYLWYLEHRWIRPAARDAADRRP